MRNKVVYAIIVDGIPRYYGKGTNKRAAGHIAEAKRVARAMADGRRLKMQRFYPDLIVALAACSVEVRIVLDGLTEAEAFSLERHLIASVPADQLWNRNPGGGGLTSAIATEINGRAAVREKHRRNTTRMWADPEFKERMRAVHLERYRKNPEQRKHAASNLAACREAADEGRARYRASLSGEEMSLRMKRVSSFKSSEQRVEALMKGRSRWTPEMLSRRAKSRWTNLSPEKRQEIIAKANAARLTKYKETKNG